MSYTTTANVMPCQYSDTTRCRDLFFTVNKFNLRRQTLPDIQNISPPLTPIAPPNSVRNNSYENRFRVYLRCCLDTIRDFIL